MSVNNAHTNSRDCRGGSEDSPTYAFAFWVTILFLNLIPPVLSFVTDRVIHDLSQTVYHAREFALGRVPYRDSFNHHFILYVVPFALVDWILGISATSLAVMQYLYQVISVIFAYGLARAMSVNPIVPKVAAILMSTVGWFPELGGDDFNYQSTVMPLFCCYIYLVWRARVSRSLGVVAIAGFLESLLILCDQRLIIYSLLLLFPIVAASRDRRRSILLIVALSLAIPPLSAVAILWAVGALDEAVFATVQYPLLYRSAAIDVQLFPFFSYIIPKGLKVVSAFLFFWVAVVVIYSWDGRSPRLFFLLTGVILGVVYFILGLRPYLNYFLYLGPFLCLAIALLFEKRLRSILRFVPQIVLFVVQVGYGISTIKNFAGRDEMSPMIQLSSFVAENKQPGDELLVWGYCPRIYNDSQMLSKFKDMSLLTIGDNVFHYSGSSSSNVVGPLLEEFKENLMRSPPRFIVASLPCNSTSCESWLGCSFGKVQLENQFSLGFFRIFLNSYYRLVYTTPSANLSARIGVYKRLTESESHQIDSDNHRGEHHLSQVILPHYQLPHSQ